MKRFYIALSYALIIGLISCDCYVSVKGEIVSINSKKPVEGATIIIIEHDIQVTSDSKGKFIVDDQVGFCYEPEIEIRKDGFKPFRLKITGDGDWTSYQVNKESSWVTYDEPVESRIGVDIDLYSQDFRKNGDSITFYLEEENLDKEVEEIKEKIKNGG